MTIRCSRCGCAKFFYTSYHREKVDLPDHHGACCAQCYKPLNLADICELVMDDQNATKACAE
ncbi:hypothetical protein ACIP6T_01460 [Pantoea sp. NPDC088449]|uniref:Uncharacterized protein n=1 Tax=Candidatus Pantoea floridensis TaxID=1938870 RepID=A0A286BQ24_9GAMM|nr:hypothetical protein [Pantoea floridensis]PIF22940.1 hypothetical protein BX596_2372 [Enterobacteriaceae bacterium JKS000233]SOD36257.1 hypothetical protein SAMN06273570_0695 [Pantoea floridensis]HBZ17271.1 hypothetical protein [Pantoea sp.]